MINITTFSKNPSTVTAWILSGSKAVGFHQKEIFFFIHLNRILPVDGLIIKNCILTTHVVEAKTKKGASPHPWWGPKRKKEAHQTCGGGQNEKRRLTTHVVEAKTKKEGPPHMWWASKRKKELHHTCGEVLKCGVHHTCGGVSKFARVKLRIGQILSLQIHRPRLLRSNSRYLCNLRK